MKAGLKVDQHNVSCPVCSSNHTVNKYNKFNLHMLQCKNCKLVFTYPQPTSADVLQRYSKDWFEREYLPSYGIDPEHPVLDALSHRYGSELAALRPFHKKGTVLDVGAGAGLFLSQAKKHNWEVHGVEISSYGPIYAKKHFNIDIFQGNLFEASFPNDYFDVIMLQDTIEHVPDPLHIMREICRILRVGGAVIISTPNFGSLSRLIFGRYWSLISPLEHLFLFNMDSLLYLLRTTGFSPYKLHTSTDVHDNLYHPGQNPLLLKLRKMFLQSAKRTLAPHQVVKFSLGTELHSTAVKMFNKYV
jgi:2-polyprenyl-3-methyl-5-hydroxy-6-metoxy-1,4-benzoquinol methylase